MQERSGPILHSLRPFLLFSISLLLFSHQPAISAPTVGKAPQGIEDRFLPEGDGIKVEVWVHDLEIPWSLVFLSDGRALVSERPGRIRLIKDGSLLKTPYAKLDVTHSGEGGLMGLALHPDFPKRPYIYAMYTYTQDEKPYNKVVRLQDLGDRGAFERSIIDQIPGGRFHNGGRIAFGPDRFLYITAGETFRAELAQDFRSLAGKVLRITPEGEVPADNPFKGSPVYSYGHRNPQGLSWHPKTRELFESEHGPSGEFSLSANDEINVIAKGGNYGWPEVVGAPGLKPYIDPLVVWKKTTPPSGISFYNGNLLPHLKADLFVSTLRSESLIRIKLKTIDNRHKVTDIERWFAKGNEEGKFGRLRDVLQGPDGALYFLTNNRDGRGNPRPGDDKILRILPK